MRHPPLPRQGTCATINDVTADDPDELESRQRDPAADAETTASSLVVLVHGAWHGAWCWAALQAELDRRGVPSLAVDLPGHGASPEPIGGLHDDAAAVTALLDHLASGAAGPITLVGHSYGGAVITQAAAGA